MKHAIDWSQPWFRSVRHLRACVQDVTHWKSVLDEQSILSRIKNEHGEIIRFVDQELLPVNVNYEVFISQTGHVPTRDNLHDFFNALAWISFPKIKRQLNALQAEQITRKGIGSTRGDMRDAATLFDENSALLVMKDTSQGHGLIELLRSHEWQDIFVEHHASFIENSDIWILGHALLEKLVSPYKAITAHAWVVSANDEYYSLPDQARRNWLDDHVARQVKEYRTDRLNTAYFTPLPVLGIPGWWPSQDAAFYADEKVFRPRRNATNNE